MKKLFLVALATLFIQGAFATIDPVPAILKSFNNAFPSAKAVKWAVNREFHTVTFEIKDVRYRIHYNNYDGKVIRFWVHYSATELPQSLLLRLKLAEPNATPYYATEYMEGDKVRYQVSFLDKSKLLIYEVDEFGKISLSAMHTMKGDGPISKF